ncbi:hypothetical protein [Tenacibaculum jejuense]|uniref:Uncharacterized protein n=1 Tax=Tenacibaculum jejuense TaxID=584609 RepID=A0A238U6M4_9FLAO|nr:hypothetical protein [Tenacibaculum jejuense]SNR14715.1 protein of unknown function [Tenacibaculum jejuense]
MFKKKYLYIKLYVNKIDICFLNTGKCKSSEDNYSDSRILFADYEKAENLMRKIIMELFPNKWLLPSFHVLIQQLERIDEGISTVEKRAIIDSCRHGANAKSVELIVSEIELSTSEAMLKLTRK